MARCRARLQSGGRCAQQEVGDTGRCPRHAEGFPDFDAPSTDTQSTYLAELERRIRRRMSLARRALRGDADGLELARHIFFEACALASEIERAAELVPGLRGSIPWVNQLVKAHESLRQSARLLVEAEAALHGLTDPAAEGEPKYEITVTNTAPGNGTCTTAAPAVADGA